jgi:hypothetical protein
VRLRNPSRRFSKAGLKGAGPSVSASWGSAAEAFDRSGLAQANRLEALAEEVVEGKRLACYRCGLPMVLRVRRTTGTPFLGCAGYPDCRATKAISADKTA